MGLAEHVARKRQKYLQYLVGKPEGDRPLKIPRRRWDNNIKVDLKEEYARKWNGLI